MLPLGPSASCCHHSDDGPSLKRSLEGATPTIHASRPLYSRLCRYFVSQLLVLLFTFTPEAHARFLLPLSHSSIPAWRDASTWLSARLPSSHLSRRIWSPSSSNGAKRSSGFSVFSLPPFPGGLDLTCVSAAGLPQDSSLVHAFPSDGAGKPPLLSRTTQAGETAQPRPALGSPGGRILWCMSPERFCSFLPPRRWIRSLAVAHPRGLATPWVERRSGLRLPPPCGASRASARQRANALVSFELLCRHHTLSALNAFGQSLAYGRENAGAETRGLTEGLPPFNARVSRSADNATAEKVDELKGAQSPQRSKSEEREHGAPLSLSSPSAALLGKTREAALEELERYERIRDTRLLMSWDAWARGVGKSPEYLKTLVTLAYSSPSASYKVEKRARPAADKRRGLDEARDAQTNASPDSRPAFSLYDDSASAEGGERELEGAEPGCLGTKSQQLEGADRRASDGLSHEAASRGQQAASASGGAARGWEERGDYGQTGNQGLKRMQETRGGGTGAVETGDRTVSREGSRKLALGPLFLRGSMEGEQSKNEKKKRARKGRGDGPPSIETGIVSEYDETPDSAKRSRLAKELRSRAEGASASVRSSSSRLQQDLLADETDPSAQVAANETLGAGAREAARVTRADEADDEEEEEGDHWGDAPQSSWTLGKLMSKREYARLLSLLRVEAVHAALEGSENEEPIPLSLFAPAESASASSAQLRRPPTVQEWAAAATGGDVKLLGEKLRESRELLDVCLRRLHPLATVAVRRFRGANLFAAQQRKLYQEQGDYDAIRALMEKRNEEEMELLLVALQGIRQGLRRHARTAMRRRVRLRKAAHAATLHAEEDEADAEEGNDDEAERELDETEEDRLFAQTEDKGTKHTLRGKAAPDIAEPRRGADERKAKTQRAETSSVAPSPRKTGESDLISPSLPELPPPPSVAYWLWMRTAMVDWEQQKRQVTQFPWRWWKEAARGRKAAHGLYAELGREPTEAEVADRLGLSLEKWRDISVATRAATALETELGGPHGNQDPNDRQDTVGDLLASEDSLESETKIFEAELETQVLDLAAKALRPDEYRMIKALISDHQSSASPFSPGGGSPAASLSVSSSSSSADAAENEREASRAQTLHFMMGDCVDEKLRKAIQKMKEVEVKRILESLSPEERREGLASPGALEKVVQRKSTVLQLCLAASTKQGFE